MKLMWSYLINIITTIHYLALLVAMESITTTINSTLAKTQRIDFRIGVDDIVGVVLYCIDSELSQFGLVVSRGGDNIVNIRISYNNIYTDTRLRELCDCEPCDSRWVDFSIRFLDGGITVICDSHWHLSKTLKISPNNNNNDYILYPIPDTLNNTRNEMFITMGNIGPYLGDGGAIVAPLAQQNKACLQYFYYNQEVVSFVDGGPNIRRYCPEKCVDNICNGGSCVEEVDRIECDCSLTVLSGLYCNRALKTYIQGGRNSFENKPWLWPNEIYMKLTWRQSMRQRMYCLMEIIGRSDHVTVWSNNTQLMMNSTVIGRMNIYGINFLTVNITNDCLSVKINNSDTQTIAFSMDKFALINIGFTSQKLPCATFNGIYDFYYPADSIQQTRSIQILSMASTVIVTNRLRSTLKYLSPVTTTNRIRSTFKYLYPVTTIYQIGTTPIKIMFNLSVSAFSIFRYKTCSFLEAILAKIIIVINVAGIIVFTIIICVFGKRWINKNNKKNTNIQIPNEEKIEIRDDVRCRNGASVYNSLIGEYMFIPEENDEENPYERQLNDSTAPDLPPRSEKMVSMIPSNSNPFDTVDSNCMSSNNARVFSNQQGNYWQEYNDEKVQDLS